MLSSVIFMLILNMLFFRSSSLGACNYPIFTDRSIFSLNLSRIQIPTGTSVTNCNHKHVLMFTFRYDVRTCSRGPHCFILTEVVVVVNFYLNRVAHSVLRLVSIGALYLKNSLHLELLKYLIKYCQKLKKLHYKEKIKYKITFKG